MIVQFFKISDDPKTLEKTLGSVVHSVDANLWGSCSVHDPQLVLTYHSNLVSANYFAIPDWNAYYFMGDPVLSPGGRCIITGKEDVLMTHAQEILNLNAYCSRCESRFERYAIDSKVPSLITSIIETFDFNASPFLSSNWNYNYLLTVKGGKIVNE